MTFCFKKLKSTSRSKHSLQITIRISKKSNFKFELLSFHSSLLKQSLLIFFSSFIDIFKFNEYLYLIRNQSLKNIRIVWSTRNEKFAKRNINLVTFQLSLNRHEIAITSRKRNLISNNVWELQWRSNKHVLRNIKKRNVRSKIRWFTKFCNSHYLSHFVAFFIDVKIKRFVVESFNYYMFIRTTLITNFIWVFDERRNVNFSKQVRNSSKQHWYVDTNEELKSIKSRLSIMILSQISWFQSSLKIWIDHNLIDNDHRRLICESNNNCWLLIVRNFDRIFSTFKRCCSRQ